MAVGQHQLYHVGAGAPPILVYGMMGLHEKNKITAFRKQKGSNVTVSDVLLCQVTHDVSFHITARVCFPQQLKALGSAQIGFGVVRGGPEVRFHERSTRVPPEFQQGLRGGRGGLR